MKKIVLTGGGTAGHIMPHIALLPQLNKHFNQVHYIGSENGLEKTLMANYNVNYTSVTTTKLQRRFTFKNFLIPFKLIKGIRQAKKHLKKIKPNIVFSKGGFVSVPVVIAAKRLKIPVVSHESDITLGLANKIIYKYSKAMCVSFERTLLQVKKRGVFTGSAIRPQIFKGNKEKIINKYNLDQNKQTILFVGGSLGAKSINEHVFMCAKKLLKNYNILHITGKNNVNKQLLNLKNYVQVEFLQNIQDFYATSDLVISRAGSNVIFELLALKKPMLLIPLSKQSSRGDQILNAKYFFQKGFARILYQENLSTKTLQTKIFQTLNTKSALVTNMTSITETSGNQNILNQILKFSN